MRKLALTWLIIMVFSSCGYYSTTITDAPVIRIAYLPITHSAAVMVLPEVVRVNGNDEFFIELVRFTAWPEVVEALRARRVDGASILMEVAMRAFEVDPSLAVVSLSHRDGNVIVVDNYVECFQGLIGKTVAIPHALSPHNSLLRQVFEREGISIEDINLVEISPAEMPFTMAARAISAYVVAEPWGSLAEARGIGRILETSNNIIPDSVCCVLLFNREVFEEHTGLYNWFLDRFYEAANYAGQRHEKVFEAFKESTRFETAIIRQSMENTTFENLYLTRDDFEIVSQNILRFGVLDEIPNFDDFVMR